MTYETKIVSLVVKPEGKPLFHEGATIITVDDEAAGEFIVLSQYSDRIENDKVQFDFDEWDHIDKAVRQLKKEWEHESI